MRVPCPTCSALLDIAEMPMEAVRCPQCAIAPPDPEALRRAIAATPFEPISVPRAQGAADPTSSAEPNAFAFATPSYFRMAPEIPDNPFGLDTLEHAGGPRYSARVRSQSAATMLKVGAGFVAGSSAITMQLLLFAARFLGAGNLVVVASSGVLVPLALAAFIYLGADSLDKKRTKGLVVAGAIVGIVLGTSAAIGAMLLFVAGLGLRAFFVPAILLAVVAYLLLRGGVQALMVLNDPDIRAAFDRTIERHR